MACWALDTGLNALGPLAVGMTLNEALAKIKIAGELENPAEVFFEESKLFSQPLSIFLPDLQLQLLFDPLTQKLTTITADLAADKCRIAMPGGSDLRRVLAALPPTTLGVYEGPNYTLQWNSLGMVFDLADLSKDDFAKFKNNSEHPINPNYSPRCRRCWISATEAETAINQAQISPGTVKLGNGTVWSIGATRPQDVLADLGHEADKESYGPGGELVWRFYALGLRLVFNADTAALERIFLFNNLPSHEDSFGVFNRCSWEIGKMDNTSTFANIAEILGACNPALVLPSGLHLRSYPHLGYLFECSSPNGHVAVLQVILPSF